MKKVKIKCKECGNLFLDYLSNKRKFCNSKCYSKYQSKNPNKKTFKKGHKQSIMVRKKIGKANNGLKHSNRKSPPSFSEEHRRKMRNRIGEKGTNWQGGKTMLQKLIRGNFKYRQWRSDVFTRDDFTCQKCGERGCYLEAHHLKMFSKIIIEYNVKTLEEAFNCEELWNINNGQTLCQKCHNKTKKGRKNV